MHYRRSARPTIYKGIEFRSRLEARYAALFDILSWQWEYEPEAAPGYIPDFALHGVKNRKVYVEIKPGAVYRANRTEITAKALTSLSTLGTDELLVLTGEFADCSCFDAPVFGYMPVNEPDMGYPYEFDEEVVLFRPGIAHGSEYDFAHTMGGWAGRLSNAYDGNALFEGTMLDKATTLRLWSRAGNAIQWKPNRHK